MYRITKNFLLISTIVVFLLNSNNCYSLEKNTDVMNDISNIKNMKNNTNEYNNISNTKNIDGINEFNIINNSKQMKKIETFEEYKTKIEYILGDTVANIPLEQKL